MKDGDKLSSFCCLVIIMADFVWPTCFLLSPFGQSCEIHLKRSASCGSDMPHAVSVVVIQVCLSVYCSKLRVCKFGRWQLLFLQVCAALLVLCVVVYVSNLFCFSVSLNVWLQECSSVVVVCSSSVCHTCTLWVTLLMIAPVKEFWKCSVFVLILWQKLGGFFWPMVYSVKPRTHNQQMLANKCWPTFVGCVCGFRGHRSYAVINTFH